MGIDFKCIPKLPLVRAKEIESQASCAHTSEQNGLAECKN